MSEKLQQLRELMHQHGIDFYYIPSSDAHQNEYVPQCWQRRQWISSFTGSAGDLVIGREEALLWTDGRYFLQAEQELDSRFFKIMKSVQGQPAAIHEWLRTQKPGTRFGADAKTLTLGQAERFRGALQLIKGELILIEENLVDVIRGPVPEMNPAPIRLQIEAHSGESSTQKLNRVRDRLKAEGATGIVLNVLDEIAWLLNIRGSDVDHNPLVISYLFLTQDAAYFYVNPAKVTPAVETYLNTLGVQLKPYPSLNQDLREATGKVWIDPATANLWMDLQIKKGEVFRAPSPIGLMKAIKNKVEQAGAIEAHRRDGLALVKFFHWLEHHWKGQTELSIMEKLESFRAQNEDFQDLSFTTIAGYAAHGAIIHYRATQETNSAIADQNLLLVDSGGQYLQGTTDVTRTVHLGQPTPEHRRMYTLVLKGHLALRHAVFCAGTRGEHLDALARLPLFKAYCNYNHGTGHGVGSYLCVHEGPARISTAPTTIALQPGMILSNEPGVYIDGHFGIRLENLVLVVEKAPASESKTGHGPFLGFKDLTVYPYEKNLIELSLLTKEEIEWVNEYHHEIYELHAPYLEPDVGDWLRQKTQAL